MATTSATKKATAPKSTSSNSSQKELDALKAKLATLESSLEAALSKISALEKVSVILEDNEDNVMLNKYIKKVYGSKHKIKKNDPILTPLGLFYSEKFQPLKNSKKEWYDTFPYYEGGR